MLILVCVIILVIGQILFKQVALALSKSLSITNLSLPILGLGVLSIALYGVSTIIWVLVLQTVPISKAYPFFAFGFVLVPLAGVVFFNESLSVGQVVGIALVSIGVASMGFGK